MTEQIDSSAAAQQPNRWITGAGAGLAVVALALASRPDGDVGVLLALVAAMLLVGGIAKRC